jgi:hypothetical protein
MRFLTLTDGVESVVDLGETRPLSWLEDIAREGWGGLDRATEPFWRAQPPPATGVLTAEVFDQLWQQVNDRHTERERERGTQAEQNRRWMEWGQTAPRITYQGQPLQFHFHPQADANRVYFLNPQGLRWVEGEATWDPTQIPGYGGGTLTTHNPQRLGVITGIGDDDNGE